MAKDNKLKFGIVILATLIFLLVAVTYNTGYNHGWDDMYLRLLKAVQQSHSESNSI